MIEIYTDGSCYYKTKYGGFGIAFIVNGEVKKTVSKGIFPSTTGVSELLGCLTALKILDKDQKAIIFCDSKYVINCFNLYWLKSWEREGWPDRLKNIDILKRLFLEYNKFSKGNLIFEHIKGHKDNFGNCLADKLADYKCHKTFKEPSFYLK